MNMQQIRVGVAGATGYAGQELVRLLGRHPNANLTVAMASTDTDKTLPQFTGIWNGEISAFSINELAKQTDTVFLALPEATAAEVGPVLLSHGVRVFDLSGAFRLRNESARARWYPETPDGVTAVYGLTEHNRGALRDAQYVACPGCYPTAALLALQPLVQAGLVIQDIIIDAKSGISGAGKSPSAQTHFSERHGNVAAYGVFAHRHTAEIEQELAKSVTFVPHLVPMDRGILETIYIQLGKHDLSGHDINTSTIEKIFEGAYGDAPFIRVRASVLPDVKAVAYTNFCDIGWKLEQDGTRMILVSCLDNLLKGAAGQAVQSFNVASHFNERDGLL